MLQHLIIQFYGWLKTKQNLKFLALKVNVVPHERKALPRGSKYSEMTWKLSLFWSFTGR